MQFIANFTIKTLFWEPEIFFKMCSQNAGNTISETQIKKNFLGEAYPLANTCLRYSAHTFGDWIFGYPGEGQGENGPFGSFAPPLKNP
jgi:hypothetical protein